MLTAMISNVFVWQASEVSPFIQSAIMAETALSTAVLSV